MPTLTWPSSIVPASVQWALAPNTQIFVSPLDGSVQTAELPGARWKAALTLPALNRQQVRVWNAFIASLRGQAGRVAIYDHSHDTPAGTATGTPLVRGAGQTGASLITDGWTTSTAGILLAGDKISVGGELKMITADASSNSSGIATLTIEPPLRSSPADNAPITTTRPTCSMLLADAMGGALAIQPGGWAPSITVEFTEAL